MKNLRLLNLLAIAVFYTLQLGITGCKCDREENKKKSLAYTQADTTSLNGIEYLLPSPSDVLNPSLTEGLSYDQTFAAPTGIEERVVISKYQALILGVYITDLSYNVYFKNHQECSAYLGSIRKLSENLGISNFLYDEYFKKAENNSTNLDSIDAVFFDFSQNSFISIENNGNKELLSLIAMGSGLESMYLCFKSLELETISESIIPKLVEQRFIFENYYKNFLQYNKGNADLKNFIYDVDEIYDIFMKNLDDQTESTVVKSKDSHLSIKDKIKYAFKENGIKDLGKKIVITRNKLIELKYQ